MESTNRSCSHGEGGRVQRTGDSRKQGAPHRRKDKRLWWVILGLGVLCWPLWAWAQSEPAPNAAQPSSLSVPSPAAPIEKATTWPNAVYLGQHFVYRITLKLGAEWKLAAAQTLRLSPARTHGKIQSSFRDGRWMLQIPLAIYIVRQYGPRRLRHFSLTFRTDSGQSKQYWFPGPAVEVRARYAATRTFQLLHDPKLPFVTSADPKIPAPSHEWRAIPFPPPPPSKVASSRPMILAVVGGGLLLLVVLFLLLRRRKTPTEAVALTPYESARQKLASVRPPAAQDREGTRDECLRMLHILRDYLHERLPKPTRHLTVRELCDELATLASGGASLSSSSSNPPVWLATLGQLFQQSEMLCFGPPWPTQLPAFAPLVQQTTQLLEQIESWQRARDAEAAAAAAAAQSSRPLPRNAPQKESP